MSFSAEASYMSSPHVITTIFDTNDPKQAELLRVFINSCGERYARIEDLDPPRYRALHFLPGGALEPLGWRAHEVKA